MSTTEVTLHAKGIVFTEDSATKVRDFLSAQGSGFEVSNPNVVASCGCGSSFRVADEEPSCGTAV